VEASSHRANQISLISILFLAFKICFRHLGFLILLNLCFLLLSIPLITHPGAKAAMYSIIHGFLFDSLYQTTNPLREMAKQLRVWIKQSLFVEILKWIAFIVIVTSIVFWFSRTEPWQRFVTIIAIYALILWHLISTFVYPVMAYDQKASTFNSIRIAGRLVLSKPFECFFYAVISFLLFLVGIILMGPILLIIPVLVAILVTLGYQQLIGSDFENVFIMASKGY
jgi:hypothetical protein